MKLIPLFLFSCLAFFSCTNEPTSDTETTGQASGVDSTITPDVSTQPTKLLVALDHVRLRATPGEKGEELASLDKETVLYEAGEVSDFTTRIKLRGIWFDEPWIKVKTEKGMEGWVYGGAVSFDMQNPTALTNRLLDLRLKSFFGKGLTTELHSYRKAYHSANNSQDFYNVFSQGEQLRDTMVSMLEEKINVLDMEYDKLPDLFWVEEALPGYETALVAEGTIYYLFQNFKDFQKLANKTKGKEDDDFVNLELKVYASDSIEYFYPAWYLQTWDYGGHSLLGQGIHLDILRAADVNLKKSNLFLTNIVKIKEDIIDDIVSEYITYWEPADKIKKELDDILAADLSILVSEDKVSIATRRKMFDNPKKNGIEVNHKAGMEY